MQPEAARFLKDMLDAAQTIQAHVENLTEEQFVNDQWLRSAAQWNLCVIGEALTQLRKLDPLIAESITDFRKIIGLRNQLIHGYARIDDRITWTICSVKVPILVRELNEMLQP